LKAKHIIIAAITITLISFFAWRFVRPMNIFIVDDRFAWPVDTTQVPPVLGNLSAEECGNCHKEFYKEWRTAIHSKAWTDPYFQADWNFDSKQHVCRLCHTPLDRQQPHKVLGYRDKYKWDPILEDNPDFDPKLQHEGVTCAACHFRDGKIMGVYGNTNAPHPVKKLDDPNLVCVRCHVVEADSWDNFLRFPPCGTVAEIKDTLADNPSNKDIKYLQDIIAKKPDKDLLSTLALNSDSNNVIIGKKGKTGEITAGNARSLGCVQCHMPLIERPLVEGGVVRKTRQHLWRGGHDPEMVKKALTIEFIEKEKTAKNNRLFSLTIANTGAAHYVPTGTPDRHFIVNLRLLDDQGNILKENKNTLKRTVMWRPFIIDLWDTRLARWKPRKYELEVASDSKATMIEAEIRYYLVDEARRKRINYKNTTPLNYEVFRQTISLKKGTQ